MTTSLREIAMSKSTSVLALSRLWHRGRTSATRVPAPSPQIRPAAGVIEQAQRPAAEMPRDERATCPLTEAERRILRYLPTNLSAPEIAAELFCSVNTVKIHIRHVYAKLGANSRSEAVRRARAIDMIASSHR
jgi:LuxR family transcriptional regulator, maltose regulon positive regulatory protein